MIKYELPGLTIKSHKVVMSTDQSHVRFVIKGTREECDQIFLTTNYPDLMIRDTIVQGVPDRDLITRPLPKDELKLSNFITNRDDYVYHLITRNLRREFASVLHDECKENLRKTKTEHYLDRQMPGYHTYRLGGANYLTAAGEVAYFYKCRPKLVAAIRAESCYDALPIEIAQDNYTLTAFIQEDGEQVVAPRYYLEPLTHRITTVAKKVPCLSKFFARYKDIFGQWFAVTPQLPITEPPGTLDLETIRKKIRFDIPSQVDLSRGGVYEPEAVDDLISWLEGNRRQDVVMHQIADQVGDLHPGEYISPKLMFPAHTLPGGSWHSFILGRIWGFFRGLGEIFSTIFGLLIIGRLVWYLVKVLMNCSYIHSVHGCSAQLAWSFCTEVFFTRNYRREQKEQAEVDDRTDNDPSSFPRQTGVTQSIRDRLRNLTSFRKGTNNASSDSEEEGIRRSSSVRNEHIGMRNLSHPPPNTPKRRDSRNRRPAEDSVDSHDISQRLRTTLDSVAAAMAPFPAGVQRNTPPPSYRTPPPGGISPTAPDAPNNDPADNIIRVYRPDGPLSLTGDRNRVRLAFTPEPGTAGPATPQRPIPQRPAPQPPRDESPASPLVWGEMPE